LSTLRIASLFSSFGIGLADERVRGQQGQKEEDAGLACAPTLSGCQAQNADVGAVGFVGLPGWRLG